jgi:hypothetical protein
LKTFYISFSPPALVELKNKGIQRGKLRSRRRGRKEKTISLSAFCGEAQKKGGVAASLFSFDMAWEINWQKTFTLLFFSPFFY